VHGDRISIDVQNAAIRDVLREIGQQAGVAIVPDDSISGEITIQMTDVTVEKALENLCRSRALVYEYLPEVKAYRIIGALALNRTAEQGGAAPAVSPGNGVGDKPVWVSASADRVDGQQDGRIDGKRDNGISPVEARGAAGDKAEDPAKPRYKAGELLVEFKPGVAAEQVEELHRSLGSTVLGNIPRLLLQRIRLRDGLAEQEAMALYETSGIVEIVERHALQYPNRTTNDPYIDRQWGLATIHAGKAWEITVGKPEVVIAVIDTGVDYSHPDLQGNIWTNTSELNGIPGVDDDGNGYVDDIRGWDFAGDDENNTVADNDPMDADGHGTHVAGIIAATGNNGLGVAGVNWQARIMPLKVEADNGESFSTYGVFEAILYAIDQGAKIVNCSFGGTGSVLELKMFDLLKTAGILAVCSAGNSAADNDVTPHYPSDYPLDNTTRWRRVTRTTDWHPSAITERPASISWPPAQASIPPCRNITRRRPSSGPLGPIRLNTLLLS
jgi:subtilisin family serine protease